MRGSCGIFGVLAVFVPMLALAETQPAKTVELTDAQALVVSDMMIGAGDLSAANYLLNDIFAFVPYLTWGVWRLPMAIITLHKNTY